MTLRTYFQVLQERWTILVSGLLLGVILAGVVNVILPRQYAAEATLYMAARMDSSAGAAYQANLLSQQSVKSYAELVPSTRLSSDVAARIKSNLTIDEISKKLSATSNADTVLISITATDESPAFAADVANAAGNSFIGIVNDVETPLNANEQPPLQLKLVQPAVAPETPATMSFATAITIGALLGLFIGVLGALVRNQTDVSLRSVDQFSRISRSPNLGVIERLPEAQGENGGPGMSLASARVEEAFKKLRTNLQFVNVDAATRVLLVTSPLQGSGKSTVSLGLARAFAASGFHTLLIDADLRRPRLAEATGTEGAVGLSSVLSGRVIPAKVIQRVADGRYDVLPAGPIPPNPSELLASQQMRRLLGELRERYDFIILDTAPVLPVSDATALAPSSDGVLLVSSYHHERVPDVVRTIESLRVTRANLVGTVFNQTPADKSTTYGAPYGYSYSGSDKSEVVGGSIVDADDSTVQQPSPFRRGQGASR